MITSGNPSLKPEQRADKNGRIVTRYVRQQGFQDAQRRIIPKVTGPQIPKFKPTKKQTEQQFFALECATYSPDNDLIDALGIGSDNYYRFSANEIQFCDMLSVTSADNAIALLSNGIRGVEDAQEFLQSKGLGNLIKDRSWESAQLLRRKVPAIHYAEITAKGIAYDVPSWNVDAAEAHSIKALREWQYRPATLPERIREGVIRLEDIKTIGATRLVRADPEGASISTLARMAKGESNLDAADLRTLIEHYFDNATVKPKPQIVFNMALNMANDFGVDFAVGLFHLDYAARLSSRLNVSKNRTGDEQEIVKYGDDMCRYQSELGYAIGFEYKPVVELCRAGVDHKTAVEGLHNGLKVNQIIAIHQEGVAPSVASGWL